MSSATLVERGFTITRQLEAPREVVFQAWTDPSQLHWFAGVAPDPQHPTTVDLRVGGEWRLRLVENAEKPYITGGIYREIVTPERLVFTWGATDGWPMIEPARLDDSPLVTVMLREIGPAATEMTVHFSLADHLTEDQVRDWFAIGVVDGMSQTLDRLPIHLRTITG